MPSSINGSGGGAAAPSGDGVVSVVGGAFVSPAASAATTRSTLGLGSLATASSVTASQISDSTAAGQTIITAADAPAQRTALGLGGAALLSVGTGAGTVAAGNDSRITGALQASTVTSAGSAIITAADASAQRTALGLTSTATASTGSTAGSIAAGNDARLIPVALASGFTDSANRFSRSTVAAADIAFDTGYTLLVVGYRNATVSSANERVVFNAFNSGGTDGWQLSVNSNTLKFLMIGASIAGGAAGAAGSLGISLASTNAAFALAIQMLAGSVRTSLNGAAPVAATRSGGTTASASSLVGLGADRTGAANQALNIAELGEIHLIQRAFGDTDLQAYALAASTAYSFWPTLTATDRAAATFSWSAVDGAVLRAGYGPLTQTGTLKRRMPL